MLPLHLLTTKEFREKMDNVFVVTLLQFIDSLNSIISERLHKNGHKREVVNNETR